MRNKITMEMSICQAGNGFSLDELVKKWQIFMKTRIVPMFFTKFGTFTIIYSGNSHCPRESI